MMQLITNNYIINNAKKLILEYFIFTINVLKTKISCIITFHYLLGLYNKCYVIYEY